MDVVNGGEAKGREFIGAEEMAKVGTCVAMTSWTGAGFVYGSGVTGEDGVGDV